VSNVVPLHPVEEPDDDDLEVVDIDQDDDESA
jgi:hypothetical protein